jgi:hypothetical protein
MPAIRRTLATGFALAAVMGMPGWEAPAAAAKQRIHRHAAQHPRELHHPADRARNNEGLIVRQPNGVYIGTDPDPSVRAYMRHDNIGSNVPGHGM